MKCLLNLQRRIENSLLHLSLEVIEPVVVTNVQDHNDTTDLSKLFLEV